MTALNPEAKKPDPQATAQADATLSQAKVDTNLTQQNVENPQQKQPDGEENADPNWRAFREARKRDRAEKEAAERRAREKEQEAAALKAALEATFTKGAPSAQAYQQYYGMNQSYEPAEETEEQRIERKVNEMLTKKEQEYIKKQAEVEAKEWPGRLKKDIPDVWQVCSQENLDYLDYHYPEVARPLMRLSDGYDKWHDTYHALKKLIPNHSTAKKEAVRAEINSNKPKSISSSGPSPTGEKSRETWQESESRRAENWARMQKIMKGVG
jgi:hypothetical protein